LERQRLAYKYPIMFVERMSECKADIKDVGVDTRQKEAQERWLLPPVPHGNRRWGSD
jgi:hypothetical protein